MACSCFLLGIMILGACLALAEEKQIFINTGRTIRLNCSNPGPLMNWYKENSPLPHRSVEGYKYEEQRQVLVMENARSSDNGNYSCMIVDRGVVTLRRFVVQVIEASYHKPIVAAMKNYSADLGSSVSFHCDLLAVDGSDPPVVSWIRHFSDHRNNFQMVDEKGNKLFKVLKTCQINGICYDSSPSGSVDDPTMFVIENVTEEDSGWYTCSVKNSYGATFHSGFLTVTQPSPMDPKESGFKKQVVVASMSSALIMLAVCALLISLVQLWQRRRLKQNQNRPDSMANVQVLAKRVLVTDSGEDDRLTAVYCVEIRDEVVVTTKRKACYNNGYTLFELDHKWEVDREQLSILKVIGEGAFGVIQLARLNQLEVAIKMLKKGYSDSDLQDFTTEMETMKRIGGQHENIINLVGVCTQPPHEPAFIIMEYAEHGNLKDYLTQRRPDHSHYLIPIGEEHRPIVQTAGQTLSVKDLLDISRQVAKGMQFLNSRSCVHRDLAARNVLVCRNNVYKIADFGLARRLSSDYYRKRDSGRIPIKWMAPEAITTSRYNSCSDIWSFGILLWEIMSFGDTPYSSIPHLDLHEWLKQGHRMHQPADCPIAVYQLMLKCWAYQPALRPTWDEVVTFTQFLFSRAQSADYIQLEAFSVD